MTDLLPYKQIKIQEMSHRLSTKFVIVGLLVCFLNTLFFAQSNEQYLSNIGIKDSVYSEVLGELRLFYIQLPASYHQNSEHSYPIAFILDGDVLLPTLTDVHGYYSGGYLPEMILVGVANDEHRTRDLTTSKISMMNGMPFNQENGQADKFLQFLGSELIPHIQVKYRASSYRTLIGHSYGGLFAIYSFLQHADLFDNYISIDPSMDWDNQKLLKQSKDLMAAKKLKSKGLYISLSGQLHMQDPEITIDNVMMDTTDFTLSARSNILFADLMSRYEQEGLKLKWEFFPEELHGTIPYPSIKNGLISLFEWFQMESTDKFNSPETSKEDLYDIIRYREQKLRRHFGYFEPPYPEDLLTILGDMNLDMGQVEKAKMYLDFAVEYYPKSAAAHDVLAKYYEIQNDHKKALEMAARAYELNNGDYYKGRVEQLRNR